MSTLLRSRAFLVQFILFNLSFFCLQLAYIYSQTGNFASLITLPWNVYWELATTLGVQICLYLVLASLQTFLLISIVKRRWHYFSDEQWLVIIWSLTICAVLSANCYYFPLSLFSKLVSPLPEWLIVSLLILSIASLGLLFVNSLLYHIRFTLILSACVIIFFLGYLSPEATKLKNQQVLSEPNIIVLGIDSLSPESVNKNNMPFLSKLLQQSTQFTKAISPLARTYPAWCSILTGQYVKHHHAEENLVSKLDVNSKASIIWQLNQHGYTSIYATDDRRFNSIDSDFGFTRIIGPKLGVNDVILGSYNDFPLGNLLINFRIASRPFPYNYSNRASFFSYYPETFNELLIQNLAKIHPKKPLFLAVHFTLPHWPYAWAESNPEEVNNEFSIEKRDSLYQSALEKVDKQFSAFYQVLEKKGYLKNCLLIILSDHGEALYYPNSRQTNLQNYQGKQPSKLSAYFKQHTATELNKSAGHGSDILSPKQYHSILAVSIFANGQKITTAGEINSRVALIDLAPTILSFLNLPLPSHFDGISLLNTIKDPTHLLPPRDFFIESGMFPNQIISKEKALSIGKELYTVNLETEELQITPRGLKIIAKQKLYGVISGDWILAIYPDEKRSIPVIQNLVTGEWTDDLNDNFSNRTPAIGLLQKLKSFYGNNIQ